MKPTINKLLVPIAVAKFLKGLHPYIKSQVRHGLEAILHDPYQGKALKKELASLWSYRVARFRIIYRIEKKLIKIIAVGPRKNIYLETYLAIKKDNLPKYK